MTIALVTNGAANGNVPSVTGLNTTGATLLVATVTVDNGQGSGKTVTDNKGNTWTRITLIPTNASNQVELWYSLPTSVGASHNITYSGNFAAIRVAAFSGTATSSVLDGAVATNKGNFLTTIQAGSKTPSQANCLLIACLGLDAGGSAVSINSGFTITNNITNSSALSALAYKIQTTAGAENPQWSGFSSTTAYAALQVFLDPGGGGGGGGGGFQKLSLLGAG
jgi:hypothetical protein